MIRKTPDDSDRNFDIVHMIKKMAEGTPLWDEMKVIRAMVGSDRGQQRPRDYLYAMANWLSDDDYDSEDEDQMTEE